MRLARWVLVIGLILGLTGGAGGADDEVGPSPATDEVGVDCGVKSLYFLLQLEGRPVDPARIVAALDIGGGRAINAGAGRSMLELRDAAGRLGVRLDGSGGRPSRRVRQGR